MERTKLFLIGQQVSVASMVRPPAPPKVSLNSGDHINVGEWVEVEHSYVSGVCSDGGIGVVMAFDDVKGADVRCNELSYSMNSTTEKHLTPPPPPILLGTSWMAAWNRMSRFKDLQLSQCQCVEPKPPFVTVLQ